MNKWQFLIVSLVGSVLTFNAWAMSNARSLKVVVSIPPQKYLVTRIGGDHVSVSIMVKPGQNPESYEPTPKQMAEVEHADLYFRIAVPFENVWIDRIISNSPKLDVIGCCGPIDINSTDGEHPEDAHVWTSPENARVLAKIIFDALVKTDKENSEFFTKNYNGLIHDLDELDSYIRTRLENLQNRYLVVVHPAWGYFARTYDLEQISVERHGSEVRARALMELVDLIREHHIKQIYSQKQYSSETMKVLAKEAGARLVELDPLAENYIDNMRYVADMIATTDTAQ